MQVICWQVLVRAHAVLAVSTNNLRGNTYIRTWEIICARKKGIYRIFPKFILWQVDSKKKKKKKNAPAPSTDNISIFSFSFYQNR